MIFFEDIEKAGYSGASKLGYAISDLVTSGIDTTLGRLPEKNTRFNERLTKVYEQNKMKEPETLTGKVTEVLAQYGVPGTAGFKILNRVKKTCYTSKSKESNCIIYWYHSYKYFSKIRNHGWSFCYYRFCCF